MSGGPSAKLGWGPLGPRYSEALVYAATLHRDQVRKGTRVAYISHLLAVSSLVLEDGGGENEAIGGLLHDAAEDQGREILTYIRQVFGEGVATIVEGCSDDLPEAGAEKRSWDERKVEYIAHLATAPEAVVRVSAADKLHNARATATDLQRTGWPKSNVCLHKNLWYYDAVDRVVSERLPGGRTADCLAATVAELFALAPEVPRSDVMGDRPPECGCPVNRPVVRTSDDIGGQARLERIGPPTDDAEIVAEWDPVAVAEAEWEGRQ